MAVRSPLSPYAMALGELAGAGSGIQIVFFNTSSRQYSQPRVFDAVIGGKIVSHLVEGRRGVDREAALNLADVGLVPLADGVSWHDVITVRHENLRHLLDTR